MFYRYSRKTALHAISIMMIKLMKLLMISYLLTVLSGFCHGQSNNCSIPSFKNAQYSTSFHCYLYDSPQAIHIGETVPMKPNVTGSNLTLIWTISTNNGETKVIDKNNKFFLLKHNNMTLIWLSAVKGNTLFKVTATNSCGQATGCFRLRACIYNCRFFPTVPSNITATTQAINESQNLPLKPTTISADPLFSELSWCFVGANNNNSVCCTCSDRERCSQSDWMITGIKDSCACEYSCSLIINSTSMKYNGGTFLTKVFFGQSATWDITHILVQPKNSSLHHSSHSLHSIYYVIGSGAGVIIVVFLAIGVVCNFKERGCCSRKIHCDVTHSVDHTTSPIQVDETQPILEPMVEPTTSDLYPPPSASYGSTEQHRIV